jgi:hypothetical protein
MSERMERYGQWNRAIAENISFSEKTGKDIIIQFIIDDGNPSRGHRKNLFNADYLMVGVACGYHKGYEVCCVMDLAAEYDDELERKTGRTKSNLPQEVEKATPPPPAYAQQQFSNDTQQLSNKFSGLNMANNERGGNAQEFANSYGGNNPSYGGNTGNYDNNPAPSGGANFDEDEDWPEGAVKCQVKKVTKSQGRKRIKSVMKVFTMKDGTTELHEYNTEELV